MTTLEYTPTLDAEIDQESNETLVVTELEPMSHIVILVPGTTDPVNNADVFYSGFQENRWIKEAGNKHRRVNINLPPFSEHDYNQTYELVDLEDPSIIYEDKKLSDLINSFANETYWDSYEDFMPSVHAFIDELKALGKPVYLIDKVRWSGDNNDKERARAGEHVLNLLLKTGPKYAWIDDATKEQLKSERVCLHLIGHSHGGNVINEFTKALADYEQKPENWSIKTIVYLSTPFFNSMHHVKGEVLDEQCDILNAFNQFDLTQRVIADYTVKQLNEMAAMTKAFEALIPVFSQLDINRLQLTKIGKFYTDGKWDKNQQKWPPARWIEPVINQQTGEVEDEGRWEGPRGPGIWRYLRDFFSERTDTEFGERNLSKTLDDLTGQIGDWEESEQNPLVDAVVAKAMIEILAAIQKWRSDCFESLNIRLTSAPKIKFVGRSERPTEDDHFTKFALVRDLNLENIFALLAQLMGFQEDKKRQSGTLQASPLFDLLDTILMNILKKFDDTMYRPTVNIPDPVLPVRFRRRVQNLDVTALDAYYNYRKSKHPKFLAALENIQRRYGSAIKDNDLDMAKELRQLLLIILIANAGDFSSLRFLWLAKVFDGYIANSIVKASEVGNFKKYTRYILERVDEFKQMVQRQNFKLLAPRELLYKHCISLINQNPGADTNDLFDTIEASPSADELTETYNHWQDQIKMQGIQIPKHYRVRVSLFMQVKVSKPHYLKDLIPHWPSRWYKPKVNYQLDGDYNRMTHHNLPEEPETQNDIFYVADSAIAGSIAYFAVFSHSVSRTRLHYGPNIYGKLMQSCRNATARLKQTN